jgi:protein-tyrosine phosphatase
VANLAAATALLPTANHSPAIHTACPHPPHPPHPPVHQDFEFDDGGQAPDEILAKWIDLLNTRNKASPSVSIAVHCIAGLGRAPLLAAIALVEKCGLDSQAAVTLIRSKRYGACV